MDTAARAEIEALRAFLDDVCDQLMTQAETGLSLLAATPPASKAVEEVFSEIMSLCAFQDLAGQRLSRLADLIAGGTIDTRSDAGLLHGPADEGGLDQAAADALFDDR
jgi:chemotaxis regulatin CheY-phosphate phosphatase CheZ